MIDIKQTFLKLTSTNYPYDKEYTLLKLIPEFKLQEDNFGNYYIIIKKSNGSTSNTMFTCHLDTYYVYGKYGKNNYVDEQQIKINHIEEDDFIKTDGETILGADDKAGMTIMLNMISENVPGLYYFFLGEEIGRLGSKYISPKFNQFLKHFNIKNLNKCVSFDRKGYSFVTTTQTHKVGCSDEFADNLASKLNEYGFWYKKDANGSRTDSHEFIDIIPECVNISVGYFNEHTTEEKQDIEFLELLSIVCTKIEWEKLIIKRKLKKEDNFDYSNKKDNQRPYKSKFNNYDYGEDFDNWYNIISNISI